MQTGWAPLERDPGFQTPLARPQSLVRDLIKESLGICIISELGWEAPDGLGGGGAG